MTSNENEHVFSDQNEVSSCDYGVERKGISKKVITAISGIVLTTMLLSGCGSETSKAINPNQPAATTAVETTNPNNATQTTSQSETVKTVSPEVLPTVESIEISASLFPDSKLLVEAAIDKGNTQWFNAGATPENAQAALKSKEGIPAYAEKIAAEYDKIFISALLIDDWESTPALVEWVNKIILIHKQTLMLYFCTSFPNINPADKEPYARGSKLDKIVSVYQPANRSYINITETQYGYDNADLNRVGEDLASGTKVSGDINEATIILEKVGDNVKIANAMFNKKSAWTK
jgi:hypothetical protein